MEENKPLIISTRSYLLILFAVGYLLYGWSGIIPSVTEILVAIMLVFFIIVTTFIFLGAKWSALTTKSILDMDFDSFLYYFVIIGVSLSIIKEVFLFIF